MCIPFHRLALQFQAILPYQNLLDLKIGKNVSIVVYLSAKFWIVHDNDNNFIKKGKINVYSCIINFNILPLSPIMPNNPGLPEMPLAPIVRK